MKQTGYIIARTQVVGCLDNLKNNDALYFFFQIADHGNVPWSERINWSYCSKFGSNLHMHRPKKATRCDYPRKNNTKPHDPDNINVMINLSAFQARWPFDFA